MSKIKKYILYKTDLPHYLAFSKKWYLPGFEGFSVYEVFNFFRKHVRWQDLLERAAAISYNMIMALPPSLLFLFTIIPHLPFISTANLKYQLHSLIFDIIPSPIHNQGIINFIDDMIDNSRVGLLSFGILAALFFSSNAMMGIMRSFNKNYLGFEVKKRVVNRVTALKLTMIIFGLLFLYLVLLIFQGRLLQLLIQDRFVTFIYLVRWFMIVLLVFFSIAFIFRYAPAVSKKWPLINPGSIIATILCVTSSIIFSAYVGRFGQFNVLYGAIGTIMMLMALIFINCLILIISFEVNVSIKSLNALRHAKKSQAAAGSPLSTIEVKPQ